KATEQPSESSLLLRPLQYIIKKHREEQTHYDGPRCPMYPSCAVYADTAIREHSIIGLLMFIDRLFFREFGRLETKYPIAPRSWSESLRYYDPISESLPLWSEDRPSLLMDPAMPVQ
ncbi:MAG: membrane protein insertion efficiency factor YidD, partial [Leptospiraceae bacterium]|nr:membrane protein insertion efficiency factor YidD [Leptospiraceae bacterium]